MRDRFNYWFDCTIAKGTPSMILWLSAFSLLIVTCFSILLLFFLYVQGDSSITYLETFWKTLNAALDPGGVAGESGWMERLILLLVTFFGLFVVSTLIGVIGTGVQDKIMDLRRGRSIVLESSHVAILGWSLKIDIVIRELIVANVSEGRFAIVILAPMDKIEMEDFLEQRLGKSACKNIICRSGDPSIPDDLMIVRPHLAKSILLLSFDKARNDAVILKRAMALQRIIGSTGNLDVPIVAEVHDQKNAEAIKSTGDVHLILPVEFITRVLVQVARQPGLSLVYEELFSFEGNEIYMIGSPRFTGLSFREIVLCLPNASAIGICDENGVTALNPDYSRVIDEREKIALIAEDDSVVLPPTGMNSSMIEESSQPKVEFAKEERKPVHLLILGWHESGSVLLQELDLQLPCDSSIQLVYDPRYIDEDLGKLSGLVKNASFALEKADTSSLDFLKGLPLHSLDEVIILGYRGSMEHQDADSITLMTLIHLRSLSEKKNTKFGIATELLDATNRDVAKRDNAEDFIASEELVSRAMVQVLENPRLETIFSELLTAEGPEIHMRSASSYDCVDVEKTYQDIVCSGMARKELVIGLIFRKDMGSEPIVKLSPEKSELIKLKASDSIVVVAED